MTQRTIEPYRDRSLPERFLRWIETIRARFKTIPNYTEFTGSPEGVIFGQKADRYYDLTADEVYVKTTNGGNTGWVLITTGGQDATFQGFGQWRFRTSVTAFPSAGQLQFDNLVIGSATEMYLNEVNDNGVDMSNFLALVQANDLVYVQISNDSTQYVVIQTDTPVLNADVYTFPILLIEGVGSPPANNTPVSVVVASTSSGGGGIANGTVEGAMLVWDVGNTAWEERTDIGFLENQDITGAGTFGNELTLTDLVRDFVGMTFQTLTTNAHILYGETLDTLFINSQNVEIGAVSTVIPNVCRFGNVGDQLSVETLGGSAMRLLTTTGSGRDLAILADNGARDLHLTFGTGLKITGKAGAHADTTAAGQLYVDTIDDGLYYKFDGDVAVRLDAGGAGVTTFEGRSGAVIALSVDYDAFYLVKTGGAQTCTSDVTIDGGGSLTIDDSFTNFRLRNSTDLLLYGAGNTENARFSLSGTLMQVTGSGFNPPDLAFQIQNWVGLDINVQTYFQPPLAVGGNSNPGSGASWNAPQGTAPTTPLDGDWWQTTLGAFSRINGRTQLMDPSRSELNVQDGDYTLVLADQGKTIAKRAGGAGETYTIPANASVAYEVGAWVAFDNDGGGDLTIAITTDTLVGTDGATGSRTLGDNQRALAQKIDTTRWRYSASDL